MTWEGEWVFLVFLEGWCLLRSMWSDNKPRAVPAMSLWQEEKLKEIDTIQDEFVHPVK